MIVKLDNQMSKVLKNCVLRKRMVLAVLLASTMTLSGCGEDASESSRVAVTRVERPTFDGARAFEDLVTQVDFGSRVPGSEAHQLQLQWMENQLRETADT
ncbi:MAG: hypothetical protein ABGX31_01255, partial [bacterium]